jgi:ribose 5-phosphate isomerase B
LASPCEFTFSRPVCQELNEREDRPIIWAMRIALGSDHRGLDLKRLLSSSLASQGHTCQDFGCQDETSSDYPDYAQKVAWAVSSAEFDCGILICSSGIGMSIAANKIKGIRAALCNDLFCARRARQHNDANILCMGGDIIGPGLAADIAQTFLTTKFDGGRHTRRLDKVRALEQSH